MDAPADNLTTYRELADIYERSGQSSERDHCLILAAYSAFEAGQPAEAERLRQRLLQNSRNHQLRAYASFERALPYIQELLNDLLQMYPPDDARQMLDELKTGQLTAPPSVAPTPGGKPVPMADMPIPPTAPMVDLNAPTRRTGWQGGVVDPIPLQADEQPHRPLAQPLPGRTLPPRNSPPTRPAEPAPKAQRNPAPLAAPTQPSPRGHSRPADHEHGNPGESPIVSTVLCVVVVLLALATAVWTFGRPWLEV